MGFRSLRVINEDRVEPKHGFPTHSHRDMEIITYVLEGALEHRDSMGNGSIIRPGDVQRMSAGTGVKHSEANPDNNPVHLLQIWILPRERNLPPQYEQKRFSGEEKRNSLRLIVSEDGRNGSVTIHQDASVYAARLDQGHEMAHQLASGRYAWLQIAAGAATLNGVNLNQGDGAALSQESNVRVAAQENAEILLFDLA
jgi:hypothetical protein